MKKKIIIALFLFIMAALILISNTAKANNNGIQTIPEKYDLRDYINISVKNQYQNNICAPVSISTAIESYVKMKKLNGELDFITEEPVFSAIPINGSSIVRIIPTEETEKVIKSFYDGRISTEDELFSNTGEYDNPDLRFELEQIKPKYQLVVKEGTGYESIDSLQKLSSINKNRVDGTLVYTKDDGSILSDEDVEYIRNELKTYIMNNGGIAASVRASGDIIQSIDVETGEKIEVCNTKEQKGATHGIVIIGWDDEFSRMNFPENIRPDNDGAYIVQNSYGKDRGDNGIFYTSYEDINIERGMYGIDKIKFAEDDLKDKTPPKISTVKDGNNILVRVSPVYGSQIILSQYIWTEHNIEPSIYEGEWSTFTGNTVNIETEDNKYLWVYSMDEAGNESLKNCTYDKCLVSAVSRWNPSINMVELIVRTTDGEDQDWDVKVISDTISDEELEKNHTYDNLKHTFLVSEYGRHTVYVTKLVEVDGKKIESRAFKVAVSVPDKIKPKIRYEIQKFQNDNSKVNVIVEAHDDESGIDKVKIESDENIEEKELVEGKATFEIYKNGEYWLWGVDLAKNMAYIVLEISDIDENHQTDNVDNNESKDDNSEKKDDENSESNDNTDDKGPLDEKTNEIEKDDLSKAENDSNKGNDASKIEKGGSQNDDKKVPENKGNDTNGKTIDDKDSYTTSIENETNTNNVKGNKEEIHPNNKTISEEVSGNHKTIISNKEKYSEKYDKKLPQAGKNRQVVFYIIIALVIISIILRKKMRKM